MYLLGLNHALVVSGQSVLGKETRGNALSCVSSDVDEPANASVNGQNDDDHMPPGQANDMLIGVDVTEEVPEGHKEHGSHKAVVLHGVVATHELVSVHAEVVAFPASIAKGKTGQSDVAVGVSANQIETDSHGTLLVTLGAQTMAASAGVAGQEFDDKGGEFEKAVDEGAADDGAPVAGEEALKRSVPFGLEVIPVPVTGTSRHAKVDYVREEVHASLRNWKPQMNSMILRIPRKPGLLKSQ